MIILGIDPGYGRLGYAVLKKEKGKEELLDYSCIETSPKEEHSERIFQIAEKITKIIKKHKPNILAIEKLFFNTNQKTALNVSEARGVILFLAKKNNMEIYEYTPLEIKNTVCGYGRATKDQVLKMISMLIEIKKPIKHDDTADAIAICLTCSAYKKEQKIKQ